MAREQLRREVLELERCLATNPDTAPCRGIGREKQQKEVWALDNYCICSMFIQLQVYLLWEMDQGSCFCALGKRRGAKNYAYNPSFLIIRPNHKVQHIITNTIFSITTRWHFWAHLKGVFSLLSYYMSMKIFRRAEFVCLFYYLFNGYFSF